MADLEKKEQLLDGENDATGTDVKDEHDSGSTDAGSGKKEKVFTQEEVNKMMAREKKQGRMALLKELGYKDEETAKSASKSYNAWLEAQKSDEEKRKDSEEKNNEAIREAQAKAEISEAKAEALLLGCEPKYVDDVIALAVAKKTEDGDFKTIIGDLKKKYPIWFDKSSDDDDSKEDEKKKEGQKGTGGSVSKSKSKSGKNGDEKSLGARLAAARRAQGGNKKSFWN